jgi:hypothetical protein
VDVETNEVIIDEELIVETVTVDVVNEVVG